MIKEYLKSLKSKANLSWNDISKASGLPEVTIRKIFSGETEDPRFETMARLVNALGGSLDKINAIDQIEKTDDNDDLGVKAFAAMKEIYEERIKDIKSSSAEHIQSLKRDKKILIISVCILSVCLIGVLVLDLLIGTIGWVRY